MPTANALGETPGAAITHTETAAEVLSAQAKALVQARYQVALLKPRDWDDVRQKLLRDCERPRFAESAIYRKPIGGGVVEGLSVRFAESAIRSMTNLQPEHLVLYDDERQRIVRISLTDIEANVSYSKDIVLQKTVERKKPRAGATILGERVNSQGEVVYLVAATEDELLTKEAALASKAMRQHALRLLPADIQEECEERVRNVLHTKIKADPLAEKKKIIDSFEDIGISVSDLKRFLGADNLDRMQPRQIAELRSVYQAIRDGETNWREVMAQRDTARGTEPETKAPEARITQAQAREFTQAWRKRLGDGQAAKDETKAFLHETFGVVSSLNIPASGFERAMAWATGAKQAEDATGIIDEVLAPAANDPPDKKACFELFEILGVPATEQARTVKESDGDWSGLKASLEARLEEK